MLYEDHRVKSKLSDKKDKIRSFLRRTSIKQLGLDANYVKKMGELNINKGVHYKNLRLLEQLNMIERDLIRMDRQVEQEDRKVREQDYFRKRACSCGAYQNAKLASQQAKNYIYHQKNCVKGQSPQRQPLYVSRNNRASSQNSSPARS